MDFSVTLLSTPAHFSAWSNFKGD